MICNDLFRVSTRGKLKKEAKDETVSSESALPCMHVKRR